MLLRCNSLDLRDRGVQIRFNTPLDRLLQGVAHGKKVRLGEVGAGDDDVKAIQTLNKCHKSWINRYRNITESLNVTNGLPKCIGMVQSLYYLFLLACCA